MQGEIDFLIRSMFFGSLATFWVLHQTPMKNKLRQWIIWVFAVIWATLSGLYYLERNTITALTGEIGGAATVFTAFCLFVSASCAAYIVDLYLNTNELRDERAYNQYGNLGLALLTVGTAPFAFFFAVLPWFLADPDIFEVKTTIRYLDGVAAPQLAGMADIVWFAIDQTGKAILFDVAEVYRFGLTNLSNNPEHLAFSTVCLVYRTLVAVYVAVIAYRLIFGRK